MIERWPTFSALFQRLWLQPDVALGTASIAGNWPKWPGLRGIPTLLGQSRRLPCWPGSWQSNIINEIPVDCFALFECNVRFNWSIVSPDLGWKRTNLCEDLWPGLGLELCDTLPSAGQLPNDWKSNWPKRPSTTRASLPFPFGCSVLHNESCH